MDYSLEWPYPDPRFAYWFRTFVMEYLSHEGGIDIVTCVVLVCIKYIF